MRRDDFILALSSGLLSVDESNFEPAIAYFGKLYELQQPARPGYVSIAGADANGRPLNYLEWLKETRAAGVQSVYFYRNPGGGHGSLPPHIEAAFAGTQTLLMQVSTKKDTITYGLRTLLSPQFEITPQQFVELMEAQDKKEQLWARVEELINESNGMNDRPAVAAGEVSRYLQSAGGREVFHYMVSQLVTEVQVECQVLETAFHIPAQLQSLLYRSDFNFGTDHRNPVFLYPVDTVTAAAIRQLVDAQPFGKEVWSRLEIMLREYPLEGIPASGWPSVLDTLDEVALQQAGSSVCRAIVSLCEENNNQPLIPAHLKNVFGPDELDGKRARARSRLSDDQWYLQGIRQPWELYLFTPLPVPVQAENEDHGREAFLGSLQQIIPFSQKIGSPFTETFLLSKFILSNTLPGGHFDEAHESNIVAALQQNGFSQYALETFRNTFSYIKDFHRLQWPAESILALCALSLSNVFGGMGSWNDMDPGEDGEVYQRVSADLFEAIRKYFAELVSVP